MKEKIIARLREKFKGVNLSEQRINAIAERLAKKVTEETEIDAQLDAANEIYPFADIAKEDDRVRTLEAKAKETKTADTKTPSTETQTKQPNDDTPEWAKALLETNKQLADKVNALESGKVAESRTSIAQAKFKDLNEGFTKTALKNMNRINFKDEDDFNSWVEETVSEGQAFTQTVANEQLGNQSRPIQGVGMGTSKGTASKEEIDAVAKLII